MILLAVDTSHAGGSLAVARMDGEGRPIAPTHHTQWQGQAMHSEVATLELEKLLESARLKLGDLTHFAVNIGPGSFTGLRVGINLARGLAYTLDLPVMTASSLAVLAAKSATTGNVLVAVKAIQKFYYAGIYSADLATLVEPFSCEEPELASVASQHGCTEVLIEGQTSGFQPQTRALDLIDMHSRSRIHSRFFSWRDVKPLYVRGSEAEEKLKKGLLKPL